MRVLIWVHTCTYKLCQCEESVAHTFLHDWLRGKIKPESGGGEGEGRGGGAAG